MTTTRKQPASLARYLLARVLPVAGLAMLAIGFAIYSYVERQAEIRAEDRLRQVGDEVAAAFESELSTRRRRIENLAENDLLVNALVDTGRREAYLPEFFRTLKVPGSQAGRITLTDYRGRPIAGNVPEPELNQPAETWLPEVEQGQTVTRLAAGHLVIAAPVKYGDLTEGAVVMELPADDLGLLFPLKELYGGAGLADADGRVLFATGALEEQGLRRVGAGLEGWMLTTRPVDGVPEAQIVAGVSRADALSHARTLRNFMVAVLAVGALAVVAAIVYTVALAGGEVRRVGAVVRSIAGSADLDERVPAPGTREFNDLAESVNSVLASLSRTTTSKDYLDGVLASLGEVLAVAGPDGGIKTANPAARAFLNARGLEDDAMLAAMMGGADETDPAEIDAFLAASAPPPLEAHYQLPDRGRVVMLWSKATLRSGDAAGKDTVLLGTDITRRVEAEDALRESEQRFRLASAATRDGLWDWDLRTGRIWFSPHWKEQLGYRDDELENSLETWRSLIHDDDRAAAQELVEAFNAGQVDKFEQVQRFRHKDGHTVHILSRATHEVDAAGQVVRMVGSHTDLTELKQRESELRRNVALRHAVTQAALDAVVTMDGGGRILEINPVAERIFGVGADDAAGQSFDGYIATDDGAEGFVAAMCRDLAQGEETVLNRRREVEAYRADGSRFPVELAVVAVEVDGDTAFIAYLRDLSEERAQRRVLEETEARLRDLAANVPGMIYQWYERSNGEHGYYYVSPRSKDLFGVEAEELERDWRKLPVHPDDEEAWRDSIDKVLSEGGEWSFEGRFILPSGQVKWWRGASRPTRISEDEVLFNGLVVDITEQKKMEEELRVAMQEAEEANRAKSEFLAMMSHEIRTPMNGILGTLQLLAEARMDERERRLAVTARESAGTLLAILNDILDYSKMEAGKLSLESAPFDLPALLDGVNELCAHQAETKGLEFRIRIGDDVPRQLRGDSGRLRQMLLNLLSNAIKFTDEGEIAVSVEAPETREIDDETRTVVRFNVRDTGIGISDNNRDRVFTKFDQLDRTSARRFGGTGLGLAITKRLAEMMGGGVGFESTPGEGSHFWFEVPLATADAAATTAEREDADGPLPGIGVERRAPRVLVAEDNPTNQMVVRLVLERLGCDVDMVGDGLAALRAVKRKAYDVVLMDISMPELDGLETTRWIREIDGPAGRVPILALTANALPEDHAIYREAGMNDCVTKPIVQHRLRRALMDALANAADTLPEMPATGAAEVSRDSGSELPLVDMAVLDLVASELGHDMLPRLLSSFLNDLRSKTGGVKEALDAGDLARLESESHALKSICGTFGASRLFADARATNDAARKSQADAAYAAARRVVAEAEPTIECFQQILARQEPQEAQ